MAHLLLLPRTDRAKDIVCHVSRPEDDILALTATDGGVVWARKLTHKDIALLKLRTCHENEMQWRARMYGHLLDIGDNALDTELVAKVDEDSGWLRIIVRKKIDGNAHSAIRYACIDVPASDTEISLMSFLRSSIAECGRMRKMLRHARSVNAGLEERVHQQTEQTAALIDETRSHGGALMQQFALLIRASRQRETEYIPEAAKFDDIEVQNGEDDELRDDDSDLHARDGLSSQNDLFDSRTQTDSPAEARDDTRGASRGDATSESSEDEEL